MPITQLIRQKIFLVSLLALFAGCSKPVDPPPLPLSEYAKKLVKTCRDEYQMSAVVHPLENTLWVYIPTGEDMFAVKVTDGMTPPSDKPTRHFNINFLDGQFAEATFKLKYDITPINKYPSDFGYSSTLSQDYQKKQQQILTVIYRTYADAEYVPGEDQPMERIAGDVDYSDTRKDQSHKKLTHAYVKTSPVPDFFVVVIADIKTGLERKMTFYFPDLKRAMTDHSFSDEYNKRILADDLTGSKKIIGDKEGKHLEFKEVTWTGFLTEQIQNRTRFKYQFSDFPPKEDTESEILKIVGETTQAYRFDDFTAVELNDLNARKQYLFDKSQLKTFAQ